MKKVLKNESIQAFLAAFLCILLGLLIGYIVLLFINPWSIGMTLERNPGLRLAEFSR